MAENMKPLQRHTHILQQKPTRAQRPWGSSMRRRRSFSEQPAAASSETRKLSVWWVHGNWRVSFICKLWFCNNSWRKMFSNMLKIISLRFCLKFFLSASVSKDLQAFCGPNGWMWWSSPPAFQFLVPISSCMGTDWLGWEDDSTSGILRTSDLWDGMSPFPEKTRVTPSASTTCAVMKHMRSSHVQACPTFPGPTSCYPPIWHPLTLQSFSDNKRQGRRWRRDTQWSNVLLMRTVRRGNTPVDFFVLFKARRSSCTPAAHGASL